MAFFDLSLNELQAYCPNRDEPADFDSFWTSTLEEARAFSLDATFERVDYGLIAQETFDVTFSGFGGHAVNAVFVVPFGWGIFKFTKLPPRSPSGNAALTRVVQCRG